MTAYKTTGTELRRGDGASPEVFTKVAQVSGLRGLGGGSAREIDTTTFDSTAREFFIGLPDNGTVQADLVWDPANAQQDGMEADRVSQVARNWQLAAVSVSPDEVINFTAFVVTFPLAADSDDVYRKTVDLRVTGALS